MKYKAECFYAGERKWAQGAVKGKEIMYITSRPTDPIDVEEQRASAGQGSGWISVPMAVPGFTWTRKWRECSDWRVQILHFTMSLEPTNPFLIAQHSNIFTKQPWMWKSLP